MIEAWVVHNELAPPAIVGAELWVADQRRRVTEALGACSDHEFGWANAAATQASTRHAGVVAKDNDAIIAHLEQLADLPEGWNGYSGIAPSAQAIAEAKQFYGLLPATAPKPAIEPSGDGEINFVWRTADNYLEIGFDGDGALSYFGRNGSTELLGDINAIPSTLPKELRIALDAFLNGYV